MSNRRSHTHTPDHRTAVDLGCQHINLKGGYRVWRTIKAVSQLLIISFAFWGGVSGTINPTYAFAGMLVIYLGVERFEDMLANEGQRQARQANNLPMSETSDEDPRQARKREGNTNEHER